MRNIDRRKSNRPVLVTGGSGYAASWIIKILLEEGIDVHATVRDTKKVSTFEHLIALEKKSNAKLTLFKADLLRPGSFLEPMEGCELVIHTASPFFLTGIKDPEVELISPAKEGTRNVLDTATQTPSVKRIVLTSSVVAMYGDNADIKSAENGVFTEKDWNTTSSVNHQPYAFSKTVAEKEAWAIADGQERWDLVVINPGWILGPSLSKRKDSMSISTMIMFGDGTFKIGVPELWNPLVDVRDIAMAHIKAGFLPEANGRYIIAREEVSLWDIALILKKHFGKAYPFPKMQAPKLLYWLIAPLFGYTRKYAARNTGIRIKLDNTRSRNNLGMTYRTVEETVRDHFQQLIEDGLV